MKLDRVTKASLVSIALFLGIIALRPILQPASALASPGEDLSRLQVSFQDWGYGLDAVIYDPRDGSVWVTYLNMGQGHGKAKPTFDRPTYAGKLPELVKPAK